MEMMRIVAAALTGYQKASAGHQFMRGANHQCSAAVYGAGCRCEGS